MLNEQSNKNNVINMNPFFKNCEHTYSICNYFKHRGNKSRGIHTKSDHVVVCGFSLSTTWLISIF